MIKRFYSINIEDTNFALKFLLFGAIVIHICYLVMFFFMSQEKLIVANIFSIIVYIFLISLSFQSRSNLNILITIFQFEIIIHATICLLVLGFGYGFELIFCAFLVNLFFIDRSYNKITYMMVFINFVVFCVVFFEFYDEVVITQWHDIFFIFNLICVSILSVVLADILEISNYMTYIKATNQKKTMLNIINHDPLTGLLNRNFLDEFIAQNLSKDSFFALVMCDVDNFKMVNDTYGHNIGDEILVNIANSFKTVFREGDFVCRWGGEEFLIIINDVDRQKALEIVSRAREMISKKFVKYDDKKIFSTLTYGISCHTKNTRIDIYSMIKHADDLLYKGKREGKNKIIFE